MRKNYHLKKQETLIKATTERGNKLQYEFDQTKTDYSTEKTIRTKPLTATTKVL